MMAPTHVARYCHLCGTALRTRYTIYETGLVVCTRCAASPHRCARCNIPLAPPSAQSDAAEIQLCAECRRTAPRCAVCEQPIPATYYTFEALIPTATQRVFCARCVANRPRCDLCRAPVAFGTTALPDGQYRCALCSRELVLDEAKVEEVYRPRSHSSEVCWACPCNRRRRWKSCIGGAWVSSAATIRQQRRTRYQRARAT